MTFTAFFGFLCYLACTKLAPSWRRTTLVAALLATIVLMGVARIDSGEHWPSDVLGGYLLGGLWLMVTIWLHARGMRKSSTLGAHAVT